MIRYKKIKEKNQAKTKKILIIFYIIKTYIKLIKLSKLS